MENRSPVMTRKRKALGELNNQVPFKIPKKYVGKENQNENVFNSSGEKNPEASKAAHQALMATKQLIIPHAASPATKSVAPKPTHIYQLPDHAIEQIFLSLNRESMLNLASSCKRLHEVFSGHKVMSKFQLNLDFDTLNLPTGDTFTRKYQKVVFKNLTTPSNYSRFHAMKSIFSKLGPNIKWLQLHMCEITKVWISRLLMHCPNVEVLKLNSCFILDSAEPLNEFSLSKLKKFKIINTPFLNVSEFIKDVTTLETVRIEPLLRHFQVPFIRILFDRDAENFKSVIARQTNLKKLIVTDESFFSFSDVYQFQLEHLEIECEVEQAQMESITDFLESQHSIKFCSFDIMEEVDEAMKTSSESYLAAMLHTLRLKSLKSLRLKLYTERAMQAIYEEDFLSSNITHLEFLPCRNNHAYKRVVESLAKKFPYLRKLRFVLEGNWLKESNTSEHTFEPLNTMRYLEEVTLDHFDSRLLGKIKLPQLKRLSLTDLTASSSQHWINFFSNNTSIKKLFIFNVSLVSQRSLLKLMKSAVKKLPHLVNIKACAGSINREAFDYLCSFVKAKSSKSFESLSICDNIEYF